MSTQREKTDFDQDLKIQTRTGTPYQCMRRQDLTLDSNSVIETTESQVLGRPRP